MKASPSVGVHGTPSTIKVITRLILLGGFVLGGVYALLEVCSSLMKIFQ
jgi:hypothetical protein